MDVHISAADVRNLVAKNMLTKAINYHASEKGIRFDDILLALMACVDVRKDRRAENPDGWVAFCPAWGGTLLRVDFDAASRDDGPWILVVTAMQVSRP